jgi:hypothetical protein
MSAPELLLFQRLDLIEHSVHARRQRSIRPWRHHIDTGLRMGRGAQCVIEKESEPLFQLLVGSNEAFHPGGADLHGLGDHPGALLTQLRHICAVLALCASEHIGELTLSDSASGSSHFLIIEISYGFDP